MKIFVEGQGVVVTILVHQPDVDVMITRQGREETRRKFGDNFCLIFGATISVRFEDECEKCGWVKDERESGASGRRWFSSHCNNPECENGFPPVGDLHLLMQRFPPKGPCGPCGPYLDGLRETWRREFLESKEAGRGKSKTRS